LRKKLLFDPRIGRRKPFTKRKPERGGGRASIRGAGRRILLCSHWKFLRTWFSGGEQKGKTYWEVTSSTIHEEKGDASIFKKGVKNSNVRKYLGEEKEKRTLNDVVTNSRRAY